MPARAIAFDFNGTLSQDEPVLCDIFRQLFGELGRPLTTQEYFDVLAGFSDREIVRRWLGDGHPAAERVIEARSSRYQARLADGSSIHARPWVKLSLDAPRPVGESLHFRHARTLDKFGV